ncbi:hypothetical protein [Acetobacter sp. LMG 32666]|uniref:hypothetical protein n=1 Tax=Acetobacter sp. LMG 32666 TaxID=2959295 RepID=UPI0030C7E87A
MIAPGLHISQFKLLIIRTTLQEIGLASDAAVNLLLGTALVESGIYFLRQLRGPALGFWQMEPATHDDCWHTFLNQKADLAQAARLIAGRESPSASLLISNLFHICSRCGGQYGAVCGCAGRFSGQHGLFIRPD